MKQKITLLLCAVLPCIPAAAQFTVEEAVSYAMSAHPSLQAALLAVEEASAEALQAGLPPNPELEIGVEGWRSGNDGEVLLGIVQTLPITGARKRARQAGRIGAEAAGQEAEAQRRVLHAHVEKVFYGTLAAQNMVVLAEVAYAYAERVAALTRQRFEAGDIPEVDWLRADGEQLRRKADLESTLRLRAAMRAQLALFCGLDEAGMPECAGELAPLIDDLPQQDVILDRLTAAPNYAARELRATQAVLETETLKRAALPEPALRLGMRRERSSGEPALDVNIGIGLPLFDRNQGAVAAARAKTLRIEAENDAAFREESHMAIALLGEAHAALLQATRLRSEVLPQLDEVSRIMEEALALGGATLFEVLAAQQESNDTHKELLELEREARTALIELLALL